MEGSSRLCLLTHQTHPALVVGPGLGLVVPEIRRTAVVTHTTKQLEARHATRTIHISSSTFLVRHFTLRACVCTDRDTF